MSKPIIQWPKNVDSVWGWVVKSALQFLKRNYQALAGSSKLTRNLINSDIFRTYKYRWLSQLITLLISFWLNSGNPVHTESASLRLPYWGSLIEATSSGLFHWGCLLEDYSLKVPYWDFLIEAASFRLPHWSCIEVLQQDFLIQLHLA